MCEGLARIKLIPGSAGQPEKLFRSYLSAALGKQPWLLIPTEGSLQAITLPLVSAIQHEEDGEGERITQQGLICLRLAWNMPQ